MKTARKLWCIVDKGCRTPAFDADGRLAVFLTRESAIIAISDWNDRNPVVVRRCTAPRVLPVPKKTRKVRR